MEHARDPHLGPRFAAALETAHGLHADQVRKGTAIPYVSHLLGTSAIAIEHGASENEWIRRVTVMAR